MADTVLVHRLAILAYQQLQGWEQGPPLRVTRGSAMRDLSGFHGSLRCSPEEDRIGRCQNPELPKRWMSGSYREEHLQIFRGWHFRDSGKISPKGSPGNIFFLPEKRIDAKV